MMMILTRYCSRKRSRQGAALLIVLAILAILIIISFALSFTSRLEARSAENFANGIQARMAASTGIGFALNNLAQNRDIPNPGDLAQPEEPSSNDPSRNISLSVTSVTDESAKININLPGYIHSDGSVRLFLTSKGVDDINLSEFISRRLKNAGLNSSQGRSIARRILLSRYGPDGTPGGTQPNSLLNEALKTSLDEQDINTERSQRILRTNRRLSTTLPQSKSTKKENDPAPDVHRYEPDLRAPAQGDDRPYGSLDELKAFEEITPEIFDAISPCLTVFSASPDTYQAQDEYHEKVALHTATPEKIYSALKDYLPDKRPALLMQFAVNLVDRQDTDDIPSFLEKDGFKVLGLERTPYINEIYPNSITPERQGDDGQFIELYNPYPKECIVEGWVLAAAGHRVRLSGKIPSKGYLIVTDDYNNSKDPDPENVAGSFYDIFHTVPNGNSKRIIEDMMMDLPNTQGEVRLYDAQGNEIDFFTYKLGETEELSGRISFQRDDPRVRFARPSLATPFVANWNRSGNELSDRSFTPRYRHNAALGNLAQIMDTPCGYAVSGRKGYGWRFPTVMLSETDEKLDSRVLDVFSIVQTTPRNERTLETTASAYREDPEFLPSVIGRININTAPLEVLESLPGLKRSDAASIVNIREKKKTTTAGEGEEDPAAGEIPFRSLSDVLRHEGIWNNMDDQEKVAYFAGFCNLIATDSLSYSVVSKSTLGREQLDRKAAKAAVKAIICLDPNAERIIYWNYLYSKALVPKKKEGAASINKSTNYTQSPESKKPLGGL